MILNLALILLAGGCAFVMGYALNQGTTCAVTAVKELVHERRVRMLVGFGVAVCVAGFVWLSLAWATGGRIILPADHPIGWALAGGAALLGIGAVLNRACLLGSISRLGDGEARFLGLPVGLAAGFMLADHILPERTTPTWPNPLDHPSVIGAGVVLLFAAVLWAGWCWMRRSGDTGDRVQWPWRASMAMLGVSGAILFAIAPGWTIADAVRLGVHPVHTRGMMASAAMAGTLGAAMFLILIAGAVTGGLRRRTFRFRPLDPLDVARSVGGGAVMAFGATLVPGGNDTLLLAAVPSGTISGAFAYAVMTAVVFGLVLARRAINPAPPPPQPAR